MAWFGKKTVAKVVDPVCGMEIEASKAAGSETHEGKTFYFCSQTCLAAFRKDPHRYGHG